jgi:hypothetical protein
MGPGIIIKLPVLDGERSYKYFRNFIELD